MSKESGEKYKIGLNELVRKKIIDEYPGIEDLPGTYTSQLEHTLYLHERGKEVVSHSDDY